MHGQSLTCVLTFELFQGVQESLILCSQSFESSVLIHLVTAILDIHVEIVSGMVHDDVTDPIHDDVHDHNKV